MADNSQETAKRVRRGRGPGRPFPPGVSGNSGGRPKGIPNFSILRMVAEALNDKITRADALGSEDRPQGVTITFVSNLQPGSLKRRHVAQRTSRPPPERT